MEAAAERDLAAFGGSANEAHATPRSREETCFLDRRNPVSSRRLRGVACASFADAVRRSRTARSRLRVSMVLSTRGITPKRRDAALSHTGDGDRRSRDPIGDALRSVV
jgi:hypothetical protein